MIGVFDSGVGGLPVLAGIRRAFPDADLLYYADTARLPFGTRSPAFIRQLAREAGERFAAWGIDFLQVACGTVSALALPVIAAAAGCPSAGVIDPVVSDLLSDKRRRILLLATDATVRSGVFTERLRAADPSVSVLAIGCPLFVSFAENGIVDRGDPALLSLLLRTLAPGQYYLPDAILLGCTHFRLLAPAIGSLFPGVPLYDGGQSAVCALAKRPALASGSGKLRIVVSDGAERFREAAERVIGLPEGQTVELLSP